LKRELALNGELEQKKLVIDDLEQTKAALKQKISNMENELLKEKEAV
jgi:hypothetical protein